MVDRIIDESGNSVMIFVLRTWAHTLLALFLLWACLSTSAALALSIVVLLINETSIQAQISAHNRACQAEMLRSRYAYAVIVERHLDYASGDPADDALRAVDADLSPEINRPLVGNRGEGPRAVVLNAALIFAAGAAGFLLRPEVFRLVMWIDSLNPR